MPVSAYANSYDNSSQQVESLVVSPKTPPPSMVAYRCDGVQSTTNAIVNAFIEGNRAKMPDGQKYYWCVGGYQDPQVQFYPSGGSVVSLNMSPGDYYVVGYSEDGTVYSREELESKFDILCENVTTVGTYLTGPMDTNFLESD